MSTPIAELFAELGFHVDRDALSVAEKSLTTVEHAAERAVVAVDQMGAALAKAGSKQGFWGGIRQSFREGWREGLKDPSVPSVTKSLDPTLHAEVERLKKQRAASALRQRAEEMLDGPRQPAPAQPKQSPLASIGGMLRGGLAQLGLGVGIGWATKEIIELGSNAEETSNVLGEIFGTEGRTRVQQWSATTAEAIGRSRYTLQEYAGQLGAMLEPMTGSAEKAEEMSTKFSTLAVDLASFFNSTDDEALRALRAGLAGEAEPLKRYGVVLLDATLQEYAHTQGITKKIQKMSVAEKTELRYQYILANTTKAQGDAARTAGGYANTAKNLRDSIRDAATTIGSKILPVVTKFAGALATLAQRFATAISQTKILESALVVGLAIALGQVVLWLNRVGTAGVIAWLKNIGPVILLAAVIAGVTLVLEDLYQALTGGKSAIGKWLDEWQGLGTTGEFVRNIAAGIDSITAAFSRFFSSPGAAMLDTLKELAMLVVPKNSILGAWLLQSGVMKPGELTRFGTLSANTDERANRAIATGRGVGADAVGNIDIPRATGRGLNADAVTSFGQAKGSIFNAASANSDSPVTPVHVEINAHTNASPKEIARHATKAIEAHQAKQNRNLRNALVPHAR